MLLARIQMEFTELGDAVHAARHFFSEVFPDLVEADACVLHGIVEQARFQTHQIHLHVGQDQSDVQRVNHVWLAGYALLILVRLRCHPVSFFELSEIVLGPKHTDFLIELGVQLLDQTGGAYNVCGHLYLQSTWFSGLDALSLECRE